MNDREATRSCPIDSETDGNVIHIELKYLIIFARATIHGLAVAHDDTHFDELAKLEA
jgi:hypothetical protein